MSTDNHWTVHNPGGFRRVIGTKALPGKRWLDVLAGADVRVEVCEDTAILDQQRILEAIGHRCDGAIGQLTERWDDTLFAALAYSNYAVGFDNVDVPAATARGIPGATRPAYSRRPPPRWR